jgi:hypothetical protein
VRLEDVENDILLACAGDAFLDAERFRQGYQFVGVLALEFVEVDQRAVVLARIVFLVVAWQSTVGVILLAVATTTIAIAVAIPIAPVALTLALTLTLALALLRVALLRVALTLLRIGVLAIACRLRALRSAGFAAGIRVAGKVRFGCVPVARVVLGGGCRELRVGRGRGRCGFRLHVARRGFLATSGAWRAGLALAGFAGSSGRGAFATVGSFDIGHGRTSLGAVRGKEDRGGMRQDEERLRSRLAHLT